MILLVGKTRLQGRGPRRTEAPWKARLDHHEPADAPELNTQRNLLCIYLFLLSIYLLLFLLHLLILFAFTYFFLSFPLRGQFLQVLGLSDNVPCKAMYTALLLLHSASATPGVSVSDTSVSVAKRDQPDPQPDSTLRASLATTGSAGSHL